jgi:hypothetical protein
MCLVIYLFLNYLKSKKHVSFINYVIFSFINHVIFIFVVYELYSFNYGF